MHGKNAVTAHQEHTEKGLVMILIPPGHNYYKEVGQKREMVAQVNNVDEMYLSEWKIVTKLGFSLI